MAQTERSVLVVDDDAGIRELLCHEIADAGYLVAAADDAAQAMQALARDWHEIALVDICLPDLDGVTLSRWIKDHYPDTEVIFITGNATVESAVAAVSLGAFDYLRKPVEDLDQIRASVARACERLEQRERSAFTERAMQMDRRQLLSMLDLLPMAVVLLDQQGHVRGANRLGDEALRLGCGLRLGDDGKLDCRHPRPRARLCELLAAANAQGATPEPRAVGGLRLAGNEAGIPALVIALGSPGSGEADGGGATAALVLTAPGAQAWGSVEALVDLYGLTRAEAQVAAALLAGHSVEEAATRLCIAQTTVRCHLRHIFAKTATSRQGELVCLLLRGPALLCASAEAGETWTTS